MLELQFPNETYRKMYEEVIQELWDGWFELHHPDSIFRGWERDFPQLIMSLEADKAWISLGRVPSTAFFLVDTDANKILWAISLRHHINHPNLIFRNGHIGYGIRPSERGKWYATQMLKLGLQEAKKLWIEKVLITCNCQNIASKRVIEKNGWEFESEQIDDKGEKFFRYWITT